MGFSQHFWEGPHWVCGSRPGGAIFGPFGCSDFKQQPDLGGGPRLWLKQNKVRLKNGRTFGFPSDYPTNQTGHTSQTWSNLAAWEHETVSDS